MPLGELPPGFDPVAALTPERVLRVRRGPSEWVLRWLSEPHALRAIGGALRAARHPSLVVPTELGVHRGRGWCARLWLAGLPLEEALAQPGARPAAWARDLLSALAALHDAGWVHRDVKAANVIVADGRAHLVDLDLLAESGASERGVSGSAAHLAPEVLAGGTATPSSDLFSLGATFAFACLGGAPTRPVHGFPAQAFWRAHALDPDALPAELSELVRRLVLRRPHDRPASARAALELLPEGAEERPAPLELPPLAGRADLVRRYVEEARGGACVVAVQDPDELEACATDVALALAEHGEEVERLEASAARRAGRTRRALIVGARDIDALFEAWLGVEGAPGPWMVLAADVARDLRAACAAAGLDGADRGRWLELPAIDAPTVARALDGWTAGACPELCDRLAQHAVARTAGRSRALARLLSLAPELGVLRARGSAWLALREDWPNERPTDAEAGRSGTSGDVLDALALLGGKATSDALERVVGATPEELADALGALSRDGLLERGVDRHGRIERAAGAAALPVADAPRRRALARRALEELQRAGGPLEHLARLELTLAKRVDERRAVLARADVLRRSGRLAAARAIAEELAGASTRARAGQVAGEARVLLARLDIAQGDARGALERLRAAFGPDLSRAGTLGRIVAAEAALQVGEVETARDLLAAVSDERPSRDLALRARAALGYADLLEHRAAAALAHASEPLRSDDPPEVVGALLHLRAGALVRLGRRAEALAALEDAAALAREAEEHVLGARTELNRAFVERREGRIDRASAALERARAALDRTDHVALRALVANNAGTLHRDRGDLSAARRELDRALALRRRAGDRYGAASSLASLGLTELEAGRVGRARETLERAAAELASGGHAGELALVDASRALAGWWSGADPGDLALDADECARADTGHPGLALRARAVRLWCAGDEHAARMLLAHDAPELLPRLDRAEACRTAALWAALDPAAPAARAALDDPAWEELGEVRAQEARWRRRDRARPLAPATARAFFDGFDRAGRTDLVRAVGLAWIAGMDPAAADERRAVQAAVDAASESLGEGLSAADARIALERGDTLASASDAGVVPGARLDLDWFVSSNRWMAEARDLEELLARIVDLALESTGARRGFLVLLEGEAVLARVARGVGGGVLGPEEREFSSSVVGETLRTSQTVLTFDAADDERFAAMASVRALGLRSVMCVPLPGDRGDRGAAGALYLDDDRTQALFDARDVELVRALADQAAIAIRQQRQRHEIEELNQRLRARVEYQGRELERARERLRTRGERPPLGGLIGESPPMRRLRAAIEALAPTDLAVLVTGPSGSGKELVVRALQQYSRRADGPFVAENVAALPEALIESELFGYARGAFTGATTDRPGLFLTATGGTFFLDEIGDLPLPLQPKLLRVLEAGEVRPVGAERPLAVDVRILAATHKDLGTLVEEGCFRRDLFYRLNGTELSVPSLRERAEDIPLLVAHFLERLAREHGRAVAITDAVLARLMDRPWEGEVRELANEVARLYFLSDGCIDDPDGVRPARRVGDEVAVAPTTLEGVERAAILRALDRTGGNKVEAARMLGISRAGLYTKLARFGIG